MAAKSTAQFFHTLTHDFHTRLTIPADFFSKYIEGKSSEKKKAELKSDASETTWKVWLTGRTFTGGWKEFTNANNLQIGHVIVVKYEGDLVFHVTDLGSNFCEIQDLQNDGKKLLKKRLRPRTQLNISSKDGDSPDDDVSHTELLRKKKLKTSCPEGEVVPPFSSSEDNSCFVSVTASSLRTDKLYLPQHFTSSNCLTRKCCKIVLIDQGKRSWAFDMGFNETSDTFYICKGWGSFCEENSQEAGGSITFKLVASGETLVLSFFPTQSCNDTKDRDCSETRGKEENCKDECSSMESDTSPVLSLCCDREKEECLKAIEKNKEESGSWERKKRQRDPTPSRQKEVVTIKINPSDLKSCRLRLPAQFWKDNSLNKPGVVILVGKDGKKWPASLLRDTNIQTYLVNGWKVFSEANNLKTGDYFRLKLIWEDTIPLLSLCPAEETKKNHSSKKHIVTLKLYPSEAIRLCLPKRFVMDNNLSKASVVNLLGKDGIKLAANIYGKTSIQMSLGKGWIAFAEANDLKTGDTFTFKLNWEDKTPVLSLCPVGGECSKPNQKKSLPTKPSNCRQISKEENIKDKKNKEGNSKGESRFREREKSHIRGTDSTPSSEKQFVTLPITPSCFTKHRLNLPNQFVRENSLDKPGMLYLLGKDGTKLLTNLKRDNRGAMSLGKDWKYLAEANNLKSGESITLELIWEDAATPMLRFVRKESDSSKANEKELSSTEHLSRDSSSAIQNRFTTLTLTLEDIKGCMLHLPIEFMKANGINKLGKITILGENGMERIGYLLSKEHGTVTLGVEWDEFCEANGVKLGQSFTLEYYYEQDETSHVLKFSPVETN